MNQAGLPLEADLAAFLDPASTSIVLSLAGIRPAGTPVSIKSRRAAALSGPCRSPCAHGISRLYFFLHRDRNFRHMACKYRKGFYFIRFAFGIFELVDFYNIRIRKNDFARKKVRVGSLEVCFSSTGPVFSQRSHRAAHL
jgi:hypothetical protein